jgi:hypothetical protein
MFVNVAKRSIYSDSQKNISTRFIAQDPQQQQKSFHDLFARKENP